MRATGKDLAEIFGYAPDDTTDAARKQWKSQNCPFTSSPCIKHGHAQAGATPEVYGSCSVLNKNKTSEEEVIICPRRLYASNYDTLRKCAKDAGFEGPLYFASEYSSRKKKKTLPKTYGVLLGQESGGEVALSNPGVIELNLDWVIACVDGDLDRLIPCEVQSIDTTGNYRNNWRAYKDEASEVPDSEHGMNWANVWKRLIPQLILKSAVASTSKLCRNGLYFIVPDRVYVQFEKIVGDVPTCEKPGDGVLTVMTYSLGEKVTKGNIRSLRHNRTERMLATDFAKSFASGKQLPLGSQLDSLVVKKLAEL